MIAGFHSPPFNLFFGFSDVFNQFFIYDRMTDKNFPPKKPRWVKQIDMNTLIPGLCEYAAL